MATRKATKQLQYLTYGGGVSQPWKVWGEYSDTKSDTRDLNEDRRYLLSATAYQTRTVSVTSPEYIA